MESHGLAMYLLFPIYKFRIIKLFFSIYYLKNAHPEMCAHLSPSPTKWTHSHKMNHIREQHIAWEIEHPATLSPVLITIPSYTYLFYEVATILTLMVII